MSRFYDDAILGIDNVVHAKGLVYKSLTRSLDLPPTDYQSIYEVLGEVVPPLRELMWVTPYTYIGITTDGDLFSFRTGEIVHLESPIVSAYLGDYHYQQLVVLLENGRPRIIQIDNRGSLISVNPSDIDENIPQDIMIISPIHTGYTPDSNEEYKIYQSLHFLAITSDNELLVIIISYLDEVGINQLNINPLNAYLDIVRTIDNKMIIENNLNLDYRDIFKIRSGWILMNNSRIYTITNVGSYHLKEYTHSVKDVIDLHVRVDLNPVLLTSSGQLYYNNKIKPGSELIHSVKFVYHSYLENDNIVTEGDKETIIQGADGGIYRIGLHGNMTEILPPNSMLSYMGRMTKPYRSVAH